MKFRWLFLAMIGGFSLIAVAQNAAGPSGKLAYVHKGEVWLKTLPDGAARQVSQGGGAEGPQWSASGQWLSFSQNKNLIIVPSNGNAQRAIRFESKASTRWSPARDELAFADQDGLSIVSIPPTIEPKRIVFRNSASRTVSDFVWSLDGSRFAVSVQQNRTTRLWRVNADGSQAEEIKLSPEQQPGYSVLAGWSSDSGHILMWQNAGSSESIRADGLPLLSAPVNGGTLQALSPSSGELRVPRLPQGGAVVIGPNGKAVQTPPPAARTADALVLVHSDFVSISPNNHNIVVVVGGNRDEWTNKRLNLVDPATGQRTVISDAKSAAVSPAWSPDGTQIAYVSGPGDPMAAGGDRAKRILAHRRIWIMNADGQQPRQLTSDPQYRDEYPLWSREGRYIVFTRRSLVGAVSIWSVNVNDGSLQRIVDEIIGGQPDTWFGYYGYIAWPGVIAWNPNAG